MHEDELDDSDTGDVHINISDVSCVGVPFASVPGKQVAFARLKFSRVSSLLLN